MAGKPVFTDNHIFCLSGISIKQGATGNPDRYVIGDIGPSEPCPWKPPVGHCILGHGHGRPHLLEVEAAAMDTFVERIRHTDGS